MNFYQTGLVIIGFYAIGYGTFRLIEAHNQRRDQIRLREQFLNALVADEGKNIDHEWERINRP